VRRDLHLGVGFLAAVTPQTGEGGLRLRQAKTSAGSLSTIEAGTGDPVLLVLEHPSDTHRAMSRFLAEGRI
jgi:hypothetical protein